MDVIMTGATGPAGLNGKPSNDGSPGGPGGAAMAANTASTDPSNRALAYGGLGGAGGTGGSANPGFHPGNGGAGGAGGAAYATVTTTTDTSSQAYGYARAIGGTGGAGGAGGSGIPSDGSSGFGGAGGGAVAASVSHNTGSGSSKAISRALGGQYGLYGNTGGTAAATAQAVSAGAGAPAYAYVEADAGAHQSVVLANAVTGATNNGALQLDQTARAGPSSHFGSAGHASSTLTFDDTTSATRSQSVKAVVQASGGAGGGGSVASLTLTGANAVNATAKAHGGQGGTIAGHATAKTKATGLSGKFKAAAKTSVAAGQLVTAVSASASGTVDGTQTAKAKVIIGDASNSVFAFKSTGQAVALVDGAPDAATTNAIIAANSNFASAFGASPVFFATGELGGAHASSGGTGSQTITDTVNLTVDLTQLATRKDLVVGLFNPTVLGSGFTSLTVDISANGVSVVHETFTSVFLVKLFFNGQTVDLSKTDPAAMTGSTLNLTATVTLTTAKAGDGFYGGFIIGDPPAASSGPAAHQSFAQAMAGMGGGGDSSATSGRWLAGAPTMLSAPGLHPLA